MYTHIQFCFPLYFSISILFPNRPFFAHLFDLFVFVSTKIHLTSGHIFHCVNYTVCLILCRFEMSVCHSIWRASHFIRSFGSLCVCDTHPCERLFWVEKMLLYFVVATTIVYAIYAFSL